MFTWSRLVCRKRAHTVRPFAGVNQGIDKQGKLPLHDPQLRPLPRRPIVMEGLDSSVALAPDTWVSARQLWAGSRVLRENRHVRRRNEASVVGGAKAIRRIWRDYGVRPNVVYVPSTEHVVPTWCLEADLPTCIVRSSPVEVRKQLLSAEYSDGYAAEFPWPPGRLQPVVSLLSTDEPVMTAREQETFPASHVGESDTAWRSKSMVVLVGLRIPSNVGLLVRAAVDMGYDSVVLINCADPLQEKVLRASEGTVYSPKLRLFETEDGGSCVPLLSSIAAMHDLLPLLAIPSQEADPAFEVAKRFHLLNAKARKGAECGSPSLPALREGAPGTGNVGPMLIMGSEAHGLEELQGDWSVPYQVLTLPLLNPTVQSYNVSVAGSILMNLFRPSALPHFEQLTQLAGEEGVNLPVDPQVAHRLGIEESETS